MKVRFTPSARDQFLAAIAHIHRDGPTAAVRFRRRAEHVLRRLGRFPESERVIQEFPELPFRELLVPPYRFFYRIQEAVVWVAAVWHSAQDVPASADG